ncbi:MAG: hypothetical protein M4579_005230 [Chaenotheca gracillima]|nr:MAG: hypothetical protein M4579_005230 [Chaenotheca gracillima]
MKVSTCREVIAELTDICAKADQTGSASVDEIILSDTPLLKRLAARLCDLPPSLRTKIAPRSTRKSQVSIAISKSTARLRLSPNKAEFLLAISKDSTAFVPRTEKLSSHDEPNLQFYLTLSDLQKCLETNKIRRIFMLVALARLKGKYDRLILRGQILVHMKERIVAAGFFAEEEKALVGENLRKWARDGERWERLSRDGEDRVKLLQHLRERGICEEASQPISELDTTESPNDVAEKIMTHLLAPFEQTWIHVNMAPQAPLNPASATDLRDLTTVAEPTCDRGLDTLAAAAAFTYVQSNNTEDGLSSGRGSKRTRVVSHSSKKRRCLEEGPTSDPSEPQLVLSDGTLGPIAGQDVSVCSEGDRPGEAIVCGSIKTEMDATSPVPLRSLPPSFLATQLPGINAIDDQTNDTTETKGDYGHDNMQESSMVTESIRNGAISNMMSGQSNGLVVDPPKWSIKSGNGTVEFGGRYKSDLASAYSSLFTSHGVMDGNPMIKKTMNGNLCQPGASACSSFFTSHGVMDGNPMINETMNGNLCQPEASACSSFFTSHGVMDGNLMINETMNVAMGDNLMGDNPTLSNDTTNGNLCQPGASACSSFFTSNGVMDGNPGNYL